MASEAKVTVKLGLDTSQADAEMRAFQSRMGKVASDTMTGAARGSSRVGGGGIDPGLKSSVDAHKRANDLIAQQTQRMETLRVKYHKDAGDQIIRDIKRLQDQRAAIQTAITRTEDAEVRKRLKAQNQAALDELKLYKQVALDKKKVQTGGIGGGVGLLGTGRQIVGNAAMMVPGASSLTGLAGGAGLGAAGMAGLAGAGALVAGVTASVKAFASFETSLKDMQAITGATDEKAKRLGETARELGKAWGTDATQGVESMKLIISALGPAVADNEQALRRMTNTTLEMAKAAGVDGATATDALTVTMSQFGYATADAATQADQMARISNVLAAASKEGSVEIPQLAEGMKAVGATAHEAGLTVEGTAAALEMLGPAGIKGAEGGVAVRNILMKMSAGSQEADDALAAMGMTFDDINPKVNGFQGGLENLKKGFEKIKDPVERASAMKKLFGLETANAAEALMNASGQLDDFERKITGTTASTAMAATKMDTFEERTNRVKAQVMDLAVGMGEKLIPKVEGLMVSVEKAMPLLTGMAQAFMAIAGGAMEGVANIGSFIDKISSGDFGGAASMLGDALAVINPGEAVRIANAQAEKNKRLRRRGIIQAPPPKIGFGGFTVPGAISAHDSGGSASGSSSTTPKPKSGSRRGRGGRGGGGGGGGKGGGGKTMDQSAMDVYNAEATAKRDVEWFAGLADEQNAEYEAEQKQNERLRQEEKDHQDKLADLRRDFDAKRADQQAALVDVFIDSMQDGVDKELAIEYAKFSEELKLAEDNAALREAIELRHTRRTKEIRREAMERDNVAYRIGMQALGRLASTGFGAIRAFAENAMKGQNEAVASSFMWLLDTASSTMQKLIEDNSGKILEFVGKMMLKAGAAIAAAAASVVEWLAALGPWGWAGIGAAVGTIIWQWKRIKKELGFAQGGLIPAGERSVRVNEEGQEFIVNAEATRQNLPLLKLINAGGRKRKGGSSGPTLMGIREQEMSFSYNPDSKKASRSGDFAPPPPALDPGAMYGIRYQEMSFSYNPDGKKSRTGNFAPPPPVLDSGSLYGIREQEMSFSYNPDARKATSRVRGTIATMPWEITSGVRGPIATIPWELPNRKTSGGWGGSVMQSMVDELRGMRETFAHLKLSVGMDDLRLGIARDERTKQATTFTG